MVPHSLSVSSDRQLDLALKLLTSTVGGGLLAAAAFLVFMWLRPELLAAQRTEMGLPAWGSMPDVLNPSRLEFDLPFPYGLTIYRCEHRGQVIYSDRPCPVGRVHALSIRPS